MMSQETTAPQKLHVENSWKDGGLFPLATPISPVVVASTTDSSSDQAMSAKATNVAAGMAVLSQGKDFHSFIRCVCVQVPLTCTSRDASCSVSVMATLN